MKRYVLATALLVACSDPSSTAPTQLNLDRPVDVAFACYGGLRLTGGDAATADQEVISTAQPIAGCDARASDTEKDARPPGQEDITGSPVPSALYLAFILESGPGTVAIGQFDTTGPLSFAPNQIVMRDADPLTPGNNGITVGEDPVAIATDRVGCYEVIANAGSCDMSILDINSVFASTTPGQDAIVNRMAVRNSLGQEIKARPAAMVFEPPSGIIGNACAATATGLAYVAYPGCHMVAGIDVSSGTIVTAIQFAADGTPTVIPDGNVSCPNECGDSGPATQGFRPVALDLELDPRSARSLLAIGAENSNRLTIYDLDLAYRPMTAQPPVLLQQTSTKPLGITAVAISPLIGIGGTTGTVNDDASTFGEHQFVYAVASDGTVRVVEVEGIPRECDTQVDPRYLHDVTDVDRLACLTVGDATTPPRRAGARGPGIELTGDAVPTGIDIFKVQSKVPTTGPSRLVGYYGIITAANGAVYVLDIDDDDFADFVDPVNPIGSQIPLTIAHQLRDAIPGRGLLAELNEQFVCDNPGPDPDTQGAQAGGARLAGNIVRTVPSGAVAAEKVGGLPSIRQVFCDAGDPAAEDRPVSELYFSAPIDVRDQVYPDLRALGSDETWTLTYEGSLSQDTSATAIDGPPVREGQMFADNTGVRMVDQSRPFCELGVEPYDVLQLRGCDPTLGDAGCPLGYTCYVHPQSQVAGLGACMLTDEAERLANACQEFLTSLRRYTIGRTKTGEIQLLPRKHVLRTTPVSGCTSNEQCEALGDYAATLASSANPVDQTAVVDPRTWVCATDPDRRPQLDATNQPLKQCLLTCETSADCVTGTVCNGGYCMEGVIPPQACINAPQRYEVRAGDAFTVIGTRTGYLHPVIADPDGNCVKDPNANPLLAGRIPLAAPPCDPAADPRTGQRTDGTFEPNPCELTVEQTELEPSYVGDTCTLATPDQTLAMRQATAIRLRNRALTLTVVDPTYQGDLRCHGDRGGMLTDVPLVTPDYQISFRQTAGFVPLRITGVSPAFPIKVTRGPGESIWIVDEGDFLSTSITQPSTRGKVYRVESVDLNVVNLLE